METKTVNTHSKNLPSKGPLILIPQIYHHICASYWAPAKVHLTSYTAAVRSKAVVLLLSSFCLLLLPLWESVIVLCFVVRYFMSILVLQSS